MKKGHTQEASGQNAGSEDVFMRSSGELRKEEARKGDRPGAYCSSGHGESSIR